MPRKPKLGQNFLVDPSASLAIVNALGDISSSTVLEIGPGMGVITRLLASRAQKLIAVELDTRLAEQIRLQFSSQPSVQVLSQDILTTPLDRLTEQADDKLVVVGNLPYYITSPILLHLFHCSKAIDRAVIMVQREVADRIAALPGTRDYGLLSATTRLHARVESLFTLPPSAFSPPPEVFSTVLRLLFEPFLFEKAIDNATFIDFLRAAFAQKRKTLANNLRFAGYDPNQLAEAFAHAHIPAGIRAEALPLKDAARLLSILGGKPEEYSSQSAQKRAIL